ncbi:mucin-2 [Patella vulgata]|uniref:mucin-2 n=1 Tax=Patella vulgata TaxID=6465 RepID=UPI00217F8FFE|nr:mucin-2 [Patella vulgata]
MEVPLSFLIYFVIHLLLVENVQGQSKLIEPPSRSAMWRYGFNTPRNTKDNGLNCGGISTLKANEDKCGICGDHYNRSPKPNEDGGKYATRTISRTYTQGETVDFTVDVTIGRRGFYVFRLCKLVGVFEATEDCLNQHVLTLANGTSRINVPSSRFTKKTFQLVLPSNITCDRCVIQWKYVTDSMWGCNTNPRKCCFGCGIQEKYINCADVKIDAVATAATTSAPTTTAAPTATVTPTTTTLSPTTTPSPTTTLQLTTLPPAPVVNIVQPSEAATQSSQMVATTQTNNQHSHIHELLEAQRAQLEELARLRIEMEEMSSKKTTQTTPAATTPAPVISTMGPAPDDPQKLKEFVQAFLSVTRRYHGNVPHTPGTLMNILEKVKLFEPTTTTPAPSHAESFLKNVLFPSNAQQPQVQPMAVPDQPQALNLGNQYPSNLARQNAYPSVFPNPVSNYQPQSSTYYNPYPPEIMNGNPTSPLYGLNPEAASQAAGEQPMFDMSSFASPMLEMGQANELGNGGASGFSPMAMMAQMLMAQSQPAAGVPTAQIVPSAPTMPAQQAQSVVAQTPQPVVAQTAAPVKEVPLPTAVINKALALPVVAKKEPLTLETLNDAQRTEILQKLKIANVILSKQVPTVSLAEKLKVYRMVINKAVKTLNEERAAEIEKTSPLVLTELTQNQQLLEQQLQIEKLRLELMHVKNQTAKVVAMQAPTAPTTKQQNKPVSEAQLLDTIFGSGTQHAHGAQGVQRATPRVNPNINQPRLPGGVHAAHPMHSEPVNFNQMDPFALMGMGGMGGMGVMGGFGPFIDPTSTCEYIGVAEIEWPCRRNCVPDGSGMSCVARQPTIPQHQTKCAMDCAVKAM